VLCRAAKPRERMQQQDRSHSPKTSDCEDGCVCFKRVSMLAREGKAPRPGADTTRLGAAGRLRPRRRFVLISERRKRSGSRDFKPWPFPYL